MLRNSTTRDTIRAVIMAIPRSSLNFLIIVCVPPLVGWKRGTHVARISVLGVPPRDRRLDLDVRAAVRVLVDQERHDDGPSPRVGSGSSENAGVAGGVGGEGWLTMLSAMSRQPDTIPSVCHVVVQSRLCSCPPTIRHWTQRLPGFRVTALVCV